jgi:acyl-CoA synthetase (AMP-forming)/AMP-acid ligase II
MLLSGFARRDFENRTALIFLDRYLTYGEIAAEGRRVAVGLQSIGIRKGDRVALHLKNSPQLFACLLGCWWIGAIAVPIRHWQSATMMISWCNYLGVVCLLVEESLVEKVGPHLSELNSCRAIVSTALVPSTNGMKPWSALVDNDGNHKRIAVDAREPAIILHTSGTTARPKAVGQSPHALRARAHGQLQHLPFGSEDVVCVFSDCSHSFGLHVMATPALAVGAAVLLVPEFEPAAILRKMTKHGATVTGGAPGYLRGLLEAARRETDSRAPKLRFVMSSSDKLPESLYREWRKVFNAPLIEGYGMTEACGNILFNRPDDVGVGTVGQPFPGVRIRIVGPDGRDVPDGTAGELWCAGDFLFSGYWNDPAATRRAMMEGWFRTGDQAILDRDGRYRIVGRTGLMIKRGGIFVSPYEVEAALTRHPAIAECIAIGAPSERWGQEVEAFLVLKKAIAAADLYAHAAVALGEPSRPVRFWSVPSIPRTPGGKVARGNITELRALARPLTE